MLFRSKIHVEKYGTRNTDLDRKDNNKKTNGYSKENCRFVTRKENANNTRRTKFLTFNGKTKPLTEWASTVGLTPICIWHRLRRGMSDEEALTWGYYKSYKK